jgi:tripartite-type tricarboxylate transporter receptor subunit TctC
MQSASDGHTLALATMSQAVFNTYLFAKLPYDALRDLEPVAPLVTGAMALATHPSFPAQSLREFEEPAPPRRSRTPRGCGARAPGDRRGHRRP